jgi:hypothetical protein
MFPATGRGPAAEQFSIAVYSLYLRQATCKRAQRRLNQGFNQSYVCGSPVTAGRSVAAVERAGRSTPCDAVGPSPALPSQRSHSRRGTQVGILQRIQLNQLPLTRRSRATTRNVSTRPTSQRIERSNRPLRRPARDRRFSLRQAIPTARCPTRCPGERSTAHRRSGGHLAYANVQPRCCRLGDGCGHPTA